MPFGADAADRKHSSASCRDSGGTNGVLRVAAHKSERLQQHGASCSPDEKVDARRKCVNDAVIFFRVRIISSKSILEDLLK